MKKLLFLGLFALVSLLGYSQQLIEKYPQNAYLVFKKGLSDKADTYYTIPNLKIYTNEAGIGRKIEINSSIDLVGFGWTQNISNNYLDFLSIPIVINPSPAPQQTGGKSRLNIVGYDGVSEIYLADESLKIKSPNRLNIQLATHSISLGENLGNSRSSVDYVITDQTGKTWVKVTQKETTIEGRLGGQYGNNHPDKQYLPDLIEDCNIYLPIENAYTVSMTSKEKLTIDFWIMHPWSADGSERRLYRNDVQGQDSFTFNATDLRGMPDYQRTIKININGKL